MRASTFIRILVWGLLVSVCGVGLLGCAFPAPPPTLSAEPFVRPPLVEDEKETGRVGTSAGVVVAPSILSAVGEGRAVFRLGERYDLVVGGRTEVGTVEGNLRVLRGPLELGWTHGFGGAGAFNIGDFQFRHGHFHLTTGLTFQLGADLKGQIFGALRGAYAWGFGDYADSRYMVGSLGYRIPLVATLSISPELHLASDFRIVVGAAAGVTMSAGF